MPHWILDVQALLEPLLRNPNFVAGTPRPLQAANPPHKSNVFCRDSQAATALLRNPNSSAGNPRPPRAANHPQKYEIIQAFLPGLSPQQVASPPQKSEFFWYPVWANY